MGEAGPTQWAVCSQMFAFSMFVMWKEQESWTVGWPKEKMLVERGLEKFFPASRGGGWHLSLVPERGQGLPWGAG